MRSPQLKQQTSVHVLESAWLLLFPLESSQNFTGVNLTRGLSGNVKGPQQTHIPDRSQETDCGICIYSINHLSPDQTEPTLLPITGFQGNSERPGVLLLWVSLNLSTAATRKLGARHTQLDFRNSTLTNLFDLGWLRYCIHLETPDCGQNANN